MIPIYTRGDSKDGTKRITISETILDANKQPISGAIIVIKKGGMPIARQAVTDAQGKFEVTDLPYGTYDFMVIGGQTPNGGYVTGVINKSYVLDDNTPIHVPEEEEDIPLLDACMLAATDAVLFGPELLFPSGMMDFYDIDEFNYDSSNPTLDLWSPQTPSDIYAAPTQLWDGEDEEYLIGWDMKLYHSDGIMTNDYHNNRLFPSPAGLDFQTILAARGTGQPATVPFTYINDGYYGPNHDQDTPFPHPPNGAPRRSKGVINPFNYYKHTDGEWYHYRYGEQAPLNYDGDPFMQPYGWNFNQNAGPFGQWEFTDPFDDPTYYDSYAFQEEDDVGFHMAQDLLRYNNGAEKYSYGFWSDIYVEMSDPICMSPEWKIGNEEIIANYSATSDPVLFTGGTPSGGAPSVPYSAETEEKIGWYLDIIRHEPNIPKADKYYLLQDLVLKPRKEDLKGHLGLSDLQAEEALLRENTLQGGILASIHDTADSKISTEIAEYTTQHFGTEYAPPTKTTEYRGVEKKITVGPKSLPVVEDNISTDPELQKAIDSIGTPEFDTIGVDYFKTIMRYSKDQVPEMDHDSINNLNMDYEQLSNVAEELSYYTPFIGESGATANFLAPDKQVSQETIDFINAVDSSKHVGWLEGAMLGGLGTLKLTRNPYAAAVGAIAGGLYGADATTIGGKYIALQTAGEAAFHDSDGIYHANPYYGFAKGALLAELPFIGNGKRDLMVDMPAEHTHYMNAAAGLDNLGFTDLVVVGGLGVFQYAQEGIRALVDEATTTPISSIDPVGASAIKLYDAASRYNDLGFTARQGDSVKGRKWYQKAYDDWKEEAYGYLWAKSTGFRINSVENLMQAGHLAYMATSKATPGGYAVPTAPTNSVDNPNIAPTSMVYPNDLGRTATQVINRYDNASIDSITKTTDNHWTLSVNYTDENGFSRTKTENVVGLELELKDNNISMISDLRDKGYELVGFKPDPTDATKRIATYAHPNAVELDAVVKVLEVTGKATNFELEANSTMTTKEWKAYESEPLWDAYWEAKENSREKQADLSLYKIQEYKDNYYAPGGEHDQHAGRVSDLAFAKRDCLQAAEDGYTTRREAASDAYNAEHDSRWAAYQAARSTWQACCHSKGYFQTCETADVCTGSRSAYKAAKSHFYNIYLIWGTYWNQDEEYKQWREENAECENTFDNAYDAEVAAQNIVYENGLAAVKATAQAALDTALAAETVHGEAIKVWKNETNVNVQEDTLDTVISGSSDTNWE